MSKGLANLLDRITNTPDQRLVDRYLALIAEIKDEEEKSARALDLAATLVNQNSDEAMRIAHMVFRADPTSLRALDIMIAGLEDRGRYAKAEVLKNERQKLEQIKNDAAHRASRPAPSPSISPKFPINLNKPNTWSDSDDEASKPPREAAPFDSKIPFIHLETDPPGKMELDPILGAPTIQLHSDDEEQNPDIDRLFTPNGAQSDEPMAPPSGAAPNLEIHGHRTLKLGEEPQAQTQPQPQFQSPPLLDNPPSVGDSDLGMAVELFDYYWRQGFVEEARDLLQQSAPVAGHEAWWQARQNLLSRSKVGVSKESLKKIRPSFQGDDEPPEMDLPSESEDTNGIGRILSELSDLPSESSKNPGPFKDWDLGGNPSQSNEALQSLIRVLRTKSGLKGEAAVNLQWQLVSAIWGDQPDASAVEFLNSMDLSHYDERFWGIYLDGLMAGNKFRRALLETHLTLKKHPHLAWAKAAYARLPEIWQSLGHQQFAWSEDDGVAPLIKRLSCQGRPNFRSLVAVGPDTYSD
jgi:hypothetical protein